jgi:microcystin-dependent protein
MALKNGRQSSDLRTILVGSIIPPGTIAPFGGGTVPTGWILCDGSAISRTTYSALFDAISTTYGSGDGLSTFTLPNAQGVFLRGAGSQTISAVSYSATRGASQPDALQNITGNFNVFKSDWSAISGGAFSSPGTDGSNGFSGTSSGSMALRRYNFDASGSPNARTSTETRPANIGVNYIIKI